MPTADSNTRQIPLTQGKTALVDAADFPSLSQFHWVAVFHKQSSLWYAKRNSLVHEGIPRKRVIYMHRHILNAPKGIEVDHKDGDGLNNCRSNIRFANRSQNCCNRRFLFKTKSGIKGVRKRTNRTWQACITIRGTRIYLGTFSSEQMAGEAYKKAAHKYHGEFANTGVA